MRVDRLTKLIDKRMIAIGNERDKVDDLISELQGMRYDLEEALEHLEDARDALSRLV